MSDLIGLKPFDIGTPAVESLPSYLDRLCRAEVRSRQELFDVIGAGGHGYRYADYLRDTPRTRRVVELLERATAQHELRRLTFIDSGDLVLIDALRAEPAWCPRCRHDHGYDRLRWMVRQITRCEEHGVALVQASSGKRALSSDGAPTQSVAAGGTHGLDVRLAARALFDWLSCGNTFRTVDLAAGLRKVMAGLGIDRAALAKKWRLPRLLLAHVFDGRRLPFDDVVLVMARSGHRPDQLLLAQPARVWRAMRGAPDWTAVESRLRDALAQPVEEQRPLTRVAKELGTTVPTLHRRFPGMTRDLITRMQARRMAAWAERI